MNMDYNDTNSSTLDIIMIGLGTAHLALVWIPSIVLGTTALIFIVKLVKVKSALLNSTILLYLVMVFISISGPSTYGLLWDISLILGIPRICTYYPLGSAGTFAFVVFHTMLSNVTGLVAIIQCLILKYGKRLTLMATIIMLVVVTIASLITPCATILNEYEYLEIRGTHCVSDPKTTQLHLGIQLLFGYFPSLLVTIVATVVTYVMLKRTVIEKKKSVIVRSVLAINTFNIVQFNAFRGAAVIVFYIGISVGPTNDITMFKLLTVCGRYIADLSYPVMIGTILIVHNSLRSSLLMCLRKMVTFKATPTAELSKSSALTVTSLNEMQVKNGEFQEM